MGDATLTVAVFDITRPKVVGSYRGDITWNAGSNTRPDAAIEALSAGNVHAIDDKVGQVDDADMAAPSSILLIGFERALRALERYGVANPNPWSFDQFTRTKCPQRVGGAAGA